MNLFHRQPCRSKSWRYLGFTAHVLSFMGWIMSRSFLPPRFGLSITLLEVYLALICSSNVVPELIWLSCFGDIFQRDFCDSSRWWSGCMVRYGVCIFCSLNLYQITSPLLWWSSLFILVTHVSSQLLQCFRDQLVLFLLAEPFFLSCLSTPVVSLISQRLKLIFPHFITVTWFLLRLLFGLHLDLSLLTTNVTFTSKIHTFK